MRGSELEALVRHSVDPESIPLTVLDVEYVEVRRVKRTLDLVTAIEMLEIQRRIARTGG